MLTIKTKIPIPPRPLERALASYLKSNQWGVSVTAVSSAKMAGLNFLAFGKKIPTDVLSFPLYKNLAEIKKALKQSPVFLGDIFICETVAKKQAQDFGHSLKKEIIELIQHGLLHLLGFDHMNKNQKRQMLKMDKLIWPASKR